MPERKTTWRVQYPLRIDPGVIWTNYHDDELHARSEYETAAHRIEDEPGRWVTLDRVVWEVVDVDTLAWQGYRNDD